MDEAIFVDGVPRRITPADIKRWHLTSFPKLADDSRLSVMEEAIDAVYTMFTGCNTLFDMQPKQTWYDKTILLFRLLACWYIADQYPLLLSGQPAMGGVPLKSKKIGPITLTFADRDESGGGNYQDLLSALRSNNFGNKALLMIRASAKRLIIGGRKEV